ncbi:ImmA/IrrE family metallo-endopeptidase [Chakrabartyella piscis]|uniref:ImmA/IrrE family metallo-endopeptidase n=1 Tax=Chakrabartyella piscis TaxID=2918914 RepID=UPI0029586FDB|nr:ImmA/IrrE family metallo-endopeptidase [Chakrabartyella piscis]
MDDRTRKSISKIADWIIEQFDIQIPITDMDAAVAKLGGRIEELEGARVSDCVRKGAIDEEAFVISISKYDSVARRNFAVAHEIGHLFLHMGYMSNYEIWDAYDSQTYRIGTTHREFEAHEFASAFLMPQKEFFDCVYANKVDNAVSTDILASYFNVSSGEIVNRGKWLGVLLWR